MNPKLKVFIGVVLLIPAVALALWGSLYRFDNPQLTETQIFNEIGWYPFAVFLLAVPGSILIATGCEDYNNE